MTLNPSTIAIPASKIGFGHGEHLLVWSWRRLAAGHVDCAWMAQEFADACGEDAPEVLATFNIFLKALGFAAKRRLAVGTPGDLRITDDERHILALVAAAQSRAPARLEATLRWMARSDRRHVLQIATGALAQALTASNLQLSPPAREIPLACDRDRAVA